jgi:AcrR family transcriptional regulator
MARTKDKKRTKEQKEKIADIAINLFIKKGYDKSSINEIIKKSHTNKGTFYHYFESKEDLMNFLAQEIIMAMIPAVQKIADNPKLNALEKIKKSFNSIQAFKFRNRKKIMLLAKVMYKEENLKLRYYINDIALELYKPIYAKIITQGKKEKVFKVDNPEDATEFMFRSAMMMGEMLIPILLQKKLTLKNMALFMRRANFYKKILKQILGIEKKEFNIFNFNHNIIKKMFESK